MRAWMIRLSGVGMGVLLSATGFAADAPSRALKAGDRVWQHVRVLADDAMQGRRAGTPGHRAAAEYVAAQFRRLGLEPEDPAGFLQPVELEVRQIDEPRSSLALVVDGQAQPLVLGEDAAFGLRGGFARAVDAPLVFTGYGLRLPQYGVDDLAGLDLRGKVVVAFNAAPKSLPGAVGAHYGSPAERWKVYRSLGAVGLVLVPNLFSMDLPWQRSMQQRLEPSMVLRGGEDTFEGQQIWLQFNPAKFATLLQGSSRQAPELLNLLKDGEPLPGFDLAVRLRATIEVKVSQVVSENVVAVLRGSDRKLRREHVVLSAHLDHLGVRSTGEGDRIFNGAMDNASGIGTLLEVARELRQGRKPRRSIVFAAVTAEEMGLLGSRAYVARAQARGTRIVANLNSDMYLPLYPFERLTVFGLEESDLADDVRAVAKAAGVEVQSDPQPQRNRFIRSDQYSFIRAGIPSLATKIGVLPGTPEAEIERLWQAERYHGVTDDLAQPVDLAAVGGYVQACKLLALRVANRRQAPRWFETSVFAGVPAAAPGREDPRPGTAARQN